MTDTERRIREILTARFAPDTLEVADDSARHAGHAGIEGREGGGTHVNVRIVAAAFDGVGRVERHRMVNDALAAEFDRGLHALSIVAQAPGEA